jgi:hypothetical protein
MPLTTAIIAIVALDLALLGLLAYVMRSPFRLAAEPSAQFAAQPAGDVRRRLHRARRGSESLVRASTARATVD